jgi:hypothetical protein
MARFNALLALGRAEEAYRHLLLPGAPLSPWDLGVARIQASQGSRDPGRLEAHLQELFREARENPKRVRMVAELAEGVGHDEVAAAAWKQLGSEPAYASASLRGLQRLADRRGNTWTARDYARRQSAPGPPTPDLERRLRITTCCWARISIAPSLRPNGSSRRAPMISSLRATVALGCLRLGTPEKARALLDRIVVDKPALQAGSWRFSPPPTAQTD